MASWGELTKKLSLNHALYQQGGSNGKAVYFS